MTGAESVIGRAADGAEPAAVETLDDCHESGIGTAVPGSAPHPGETEPTD